MRVLHVTSNWKWTGPSEPMLQLMRAQRSRGYQVALACPEHPEGIRPNVAERVRGEGFETVCRLLAVRGSRWWRDSEDARRLREALTRGRYDVLHVWHNRDHALAWRAAGGWRRPTQLRIVRSWADGGSVPGLPWNRLLFGVCTDGLLCVSDAAARSGATLLRGRPAASAGGGVDLERFHPAPPDPEVRAGLGLAPAHRVVGIVARVQRHRRFDLLLEAMARLARRDPQARLLVVGRGTHLNTVARQPAVRLGIEDRVVFAGHRLADYPDVLRALDVFTYLVPGSDGSCRALLEAQACGIPAVATRRGALTEIVAHRETGLLVPEDPAALASAWEALLGDPARRAALGRAARRRAEDRFGGERLAERVEALYVRAGASVA